MSELLSFNGKSTTDAVSALHELWEKRDLEAVYNRCFSDDVNFTIFATTMRALSSAGYEPKSHVTLWESMTALLERVPEKPGKAFLFNDGLVPGNGQATSLCVSEDGNVIAYLTNSATRLQDGITGKGFSRTELAAALERKEPIKVARMINLVRFDPYNAWSINISDDESVFGNSLILLHVGEKDIYAINDGANDQKSLYRIPVDEAENVSVIASNRIPGRCYDLNAQRGVFCYIDFDQKSIVELTLAGNEKHVIPLDLPDDIGVEALHQLKASPDGRTLVITINNGSEEHRFVFGILRKQRGDASDAAEVKWFPRKDLPCAKHLVETQFGPVFDNVVFGRMEKAFHFIEMTGEIFAIDLADIDAATDLQSLDGMDLLRPFTKVIGKNDAYAKLAVAKHLPLATSYEQKTRMIRVWDTARRSLLFSLSSPTMCEALAFAQDDRILLTVSRSTKTPDGRLSATFIDYALLSGRPPIEYRSDDLVRLQPLMALAPEDGELKVMECVIRYFGMLNELPAK